MTWFTRLLLWLLERRPDIYLDLSDIQGDGDELDAVDYLEMCYELDGAVTGDRPIHGEDSP